MAIEARPLWAGICVAPLLLDLVRTASCADAANDEMFSTDREPQLMQHLFGEGWADTIR